MNLEGVESVLKAMIKHKIRLTPMLWGKHSIGKTASVEALEGVPLEMHGHDKPVQFKVKTMMLSQREAIDILGLPEKGTSKKGTPMMISAMPDWFVDAYENGYYIIFLDELNHARKDVLNAAHEFIQKGTVNGFKLPDTCFIIAGGNPDDGTDRYDVTSLTQSMVTRMMHLHVKPHTPSWLNWARKTNKVTGKPNIHKNVSKFIQTMPDLAYVKGDKDEIFPVIIEYGYRSLEQLSWIHETSLEASLKAECYRGLVGPDTAAAFVQFCNRTDHPLDHKEIFEFDEEARERIASFIDNGNGVTRTELLTQSINNLSAFVNVKDAEAQTKNQVEADKHIGNIIKFLEMLPDEMLRKAVIDLYNVLDWADKLKANRSLWKRIVVEIPKGAQVPTKA